MKDKKKLKLIDKAIKVTDELIELIAKERLKNMDKSKLVSHKDMFKGK